VIVYVDTSAAMKLLVEEKESATLADHLQRRTQDGDTLIASMLLHTELHCSANRRPEHIQHEAVSEVLSAIALVDMENGDLTTAPLLPGRLRSADAIHLATALRLNARAMVGYAAELNAACRIAGIEALSPGATSD
jgi:predicted nucleic acid-binding protein